MITRFHIHDGQCDFRQRWAQTDKWKLEHEAGTALFGVYRNPLTDDPMRSRAMIRSTANTNAWVYGGKLWALKEDCPALVMDPATMETDGFEKFGGKMTGQTFTAHPKIDPGDRQHGRDRLCRLGPLHRRCHLLRSRARRRAGPRGVVQGSLLLHDARFRRSPRITSCSTSCRRSAAGSGSSRACPISASTRRCRSISASSRAATTLKQEDIRWFKRDNCFASHVLNAWQEGTKIHFLDARGEEQHVPLLPRRARRAVQPDGGDEPPDRLDGGHGQQRRRVRRDHAADRNASANSRGSTTASPAGRTATAGGSKWTCGARSSSRAAARAGC